MDLAFPAADFCISQSFSSPFPFSAPHGGASQGRRPCRSLSLSLMRSAFTNPGRNKNVLAISLIAPFGVTEGRGLCSFASLQTNASNRLPSSKRKGLFSEGLPPFPRNFRIKAFRSFVGSSQIGTSHPDKGRRKNVERLKSLILPGELKRHDSVIYKLSLPPSLEWVDYLTDRKMYKFRSLDLSPYSKKGQGPEAARAIVRNEGERR